MRCAYAGQPPRHDLAALGDELPQHAVILVIDVFNFLDAELANFLAPEKLATAAAFARRPARPTSAPTATKARTVATRAIPTRPVSTRAVPAGTRPLARRRLLCCFRLFSHSSPICWVALPAIPNTLSFRAKRGICFCPTYPRMPPGPPGRFTPSPEFPPQAQPVPPLPAGPPAARSPSSSSRATA